ncbi:hypothetical protein BD770DRAFT_393689 [Pilaira anomala]|nr:hypothetical protein BD770DRAFT_393689 [Pilaira anomala]
MSVNTCDIVSVDDVIDLNYEDTKSSTSGSQHNNYRISLHSIDDDELRMFHRDLVTPAPSVCFDHEFDIRQQQQRSSFRRPVSRTESVMLFKKINNGDEDVSSFDLVSSELRDFLDTDFMMEGILSRPVSRTTISKNASKIQDINKFRHTLQKRNDLLPKTSTHTSSGNNTTTTATTTTITNSRPVVKKDESFKKLNNHSYITPPKSYKKKSLDNLPNLRPKSFTRTFEPVHEPRIPEPSRHQDINKRTTESAHSNRIYDKRMSESRLYEPRVIPEPTRLYHERRTSIETPRMPELRVPRKPGFSSHRDRMRSETTISSSSSSSEEEEYWMQRSSQLLKDIKNVPGRLKPKSIINTAQDIPLLSTGQQQHRYSISNHQRYISTDQDFYNNKSTQDIPVSTQQQQQHIPPVSTQQQQQHIPVSTQQQQQQHYSSPVLHHRYSVPNNPRYISTTDHTTSIEYNKSISTRNKGHYTKTNEVTDSAKQVLACIRERRKSALVLETARSIPQPEEQQPFISDFRTRLQIHRDNTNRRSSSNIIQQPPPQQQQKYNIPTSRRYEEVSNNSRYI